MHCERATIEQTLRKLPLIHTSNQNHLILVTQAGFLKGGAEARHGLHVCVVPKLLRLPNVNGCLLHSTPIPFPTVSWHLPLPLPP